MTTEQASSQSARFDLKPNRAEIDRAVGLICEPFHTYELRAPNTTKAAISGYFDDLAKLADAAVTASEPTFEAPGVYLTINPVKHELIARASNRLELFAKFTTADADVVARRMLPIDIDPVRPAGISSTDDQHAAALACAQQVREYLRQRGWPSPMMVDSGNGAHLLYRIDLPNDSTSRTLVSRILEALALTFDDDAVAVDRTCFNAARILKIPGTVARKGDSLPERPHRVSRTLNEGNGESGGIVTREQLEALAATLPEKSAIARNASQQHASMAAWIAGHGVAIKREIAWNGGTKFILNHCLFDTGHAGSSAVLIELASGARVYRCLHNGCIDKKWSDVRALFGESPALRVVRENKTIAGDQDEPSEAMGDILVADKFLDQHRENVRYCPMRGWLIWDKRRWQWDDREQIVKLAEQTVRGLYRDAAARKDKDQRETLLKLAGTYSKAERIRAMLTIARPHVAVVQDELDRDIYLLNCRNGTVDLRDVQLQPHLREDLITKLVDVDYLGDKSKAPRFEQFLSEVFQDRTELIDYVQRAVGYSFTGDVREEELYFLHGGGLNGKSTLLQILLQAAGDYGHTAPAAMLLVKKFEDAIPTDRADLCGKRFVVINETPADRALAEDAVKNISSHEEITARHLYRERFTFSPTHHIWISGNHKPIVRGTDTAIWRRINLVPFDSKFEGDADDKGLRATLQAELPGILSWIVRGAVAWFKEGRLRKPEVVIAATKQYRDEQDVLADFIRDCCEVGANLEVPFKDLYRTYQAWAEESGERRPWSKTRFGLRLGDHGFPSKHFRGGDIRCGLEVRL